MAKFKKNHFLVFQGKYVKVVRIYKIGFLDFIVYKVLDFESNKVLYVFEDDLKIYQYPD